MPDVFISHASEDREAASRIAAYLEDQGVACWIAPRDVPPGGEYGAAIMTAIEDARALVLVLSEPANQSQFVRREVERAVARLKPVLPVRVREVTPSGALEFFVASAQWVDAYQPPIEHHLAPLAAAIRALAGAAPAAGPLPKARRRPWRPAALALALLAAAAAAWVWRDGRALDPVAALSGTWCEPVNDLIVIYRFTPSGPGRLQMQFDHPQAELQGSEVTVSLADPTTIALRFADSEAGADPGMLLGRLDDHTLAPVSTPGGPPTGAYLTRCPGRP